MKNKKSIIAKTFTPKYDEEEDRLRVVVNYEDVYNRVDFMITRSFMLNLAPTADDFILQYYALEQKRVDAAELILSIDNKEDKTMLQTNDIDLELFRTDEELLIKVNFSYQKDSNKTAVTFFSKNVTAEILLDGKMLQQIFTLIKSAIPYYKWGISHHF